MRLFGVTDKTQTAKRQVEKANSEAKQWGQEVANLKVEYDRLQARKKALLEDYSTKSKEALWELAQSKGALLQEIKALELRRAEAMRPVDDEIKELERRQRLINAKEDELRALNDDLSNQIKELELAKSTLDKRAYELEQKSKLLDDRASSLANDRAQLIEERKIFTGDSAKAKTNLEALQKAANDQLAKAELLNISTTNKAEWIKQMEAKLVEERKRVEYDRLKLKQARDLWQREKETKTG